jgi:hypothetical protein
MEGKLMNRSEMLEKVYTGCPVHGAHSYYCDNCQKAALGNLVSLVIDLHEGKMENNGEPTRTQ